MSALPFSFVLHLHQPVGNFDHVFRQHADEVYTPFFDFLAERALWPLALHVSGPLLEWLEDNDRALHDRIGRLASDGRVELLSAGWYEPILAALPRVDRAEQLERMRAELVRRFGVVPRGAWLTERVWEPDLPADLARAGLEYTLVDDHLAHRAGVDPAVVARPIRTEADGHGLDVLTIDERLRYLIPFRPAEEIAAELRARADRGEPLALFGDDFEKFGGWPRTKAWLYEGGWLAAFGDAMDALRGEGVVRWVTPTQARAEVSASGPVYLPSGSYAEMEGWARGGHWKGFLSRYPEANRMHKRMIALSAASRGRGDPAEVRLAVARAQCNDAYWHGVFGGLYMKHLREGVRGQLLRAERLLRRGESLAWTRADVDADGEPEWWVHGEAVSAWVRSDGSISDLLWLEAGIDVLDVLTRTREAYHDEAHRRWLELAEGVAGPDPGTGAGEAPGAGEGTVARAGIGAAAPSIHDVESEAVLRRLPAVDDATRVLVRDRMLPPGTGEEAYRDGSYRALWRGDRYLAEEGGAPRSDGPDGPFVLQARSPDGPAVRKVLTIRADGTVQYEWRWEAEGLPDGAFFAPELSLGAEVRVTLEPDVSAWRWPIVTVSKCPDGFEEIEQGTSITPLWPARAGRARLSIAPPRS